MRIFGKLGVWLQCMVAFSVVVTRTVDAQPPSRAGNVPKKVGGEAVGDILRRLGAKLVREVTAKELDDYENHFNRTDPNRDGKHTKEEYVDNGGYMTPQARAGIFRAADGNADGIVTRAEYVLNRIITDEAKVIVQGMDDDKDGSVERTEFIKHATRLLSSPDLADQVFAAFDANDDGGITIPEYLRVWGQWARARQKPAEQRIAARRAELAASTLEEDVAGESDKMSARPGEGRLAGRFPPRRPGGGPPSGRPGERAGPPSVEEVFERFDGNKDGKLQKDEVPEFAQQFILPADADGDDLVTKEELQASRQRQPLGGRPAAGAPRQPNRQGRPRRPAGRPGSRPLPGSRKPTRQSTTAHALDLSSVRDGHNLVVDKGGKEVPPQGRPFQDGYRLVRTDAPVGDHNRRAYARVFSIMAPIRDALIFNLGTTSEEEWTALTAILKKNQIKTKQWLGGPTPRDNYYSNEGIFVHLKKEGPDYHPMMKYLEEAELALKAALFSRDFDFTNPEGINPYPDPGQGLVE